MIMIGTSGFSYNDWRGVFYPEKTRPSDYLKYYAEVFDTCELNFSYYRLPDESTFERMLEKSEGKVSFSVKAYKEITHKSECAPEVISQFKKSLYPLQRESKLSSILFQFPYSFKDVHSGKEYISLVCGEFGEFPIVIEFRNKVWLSDDTFSFLREKNIGFVCVDEPKLRGLLPPVAVAVSDISYVRFHGRNREKWRDHKEAWERYDYDYSDEELSEWILKLKELEENSKKTLVYMNNHYRGNAVKNAKRLKEIMELDK